MLEYPLRVDILLRPSQIAGRVRRSQQGALRVKELSLLDFVRVIHPVQAGQTQSRLSGQNTLCEVLAFPLVRTGDHRSRVWTLHVLLVPSTNHTLMERHVPNPRGLLDWLRDEVIH